MAVRLRDGGAVEKWQLAGLGAPPSQMAMPTQQLVVLRVPWVAGSSPHIASWPASECPPALIPTVYNRGCVSQQRTSCPACPVRPQVSYCILAGIGVSSILVFWMVSLHRSRERKRRLARAKRAFTNRWHSVTSSMGLAASAVAAFKAKGAAAAAAARGNGKGSGSGGKGSDGVQGSAPSTQSGQGGVKGGAPRLRSRLQSSRVSWGSEVGNAAIAAAGGAGEATAAPPAVPPAGTNSSPQPDALPTSPFEGAGAGGAAPSRWQAAAAASSAAQPPLETAGTISGPQGGGEL